MSTAEGICIKSPRGDDCFGLEAELNGFYAWVGISHLKIV